jgi:hypothetical protein
MPRELVHRKAFESRGETQVRVLAQQGGEIGAEAVAWLAEQQALRDAAAADKRDAREEETLRIANEALASAKEANRIASSASAAAERQAKAAERQARWAMYAAAIAIVAAVSDANALIRELISWLQK